MKERVIKASKALMGQRIKKMWKGERQMVEKMLRKAKSRSEMVCMGGNVCPCACIS